MLGLLLCCCIAAGAMAAEEVEIEEGVFQGYDGYGPLLRGVYHTKYPELSDLKIEENGKTLKAGDTVHISVKATAYDTDVDYVNVEIGRNRNEYRNLRMSLNAQTGRYEGTYTFTAQDRPGEYYIAYANIHDKYSFYTNYSSSSKRVMKRLFPGSVVLKNDSYTKIFKNITLTENGKELTPGSTLHLSFDLPKNLNIERAYISFYGKGDYDLYLHYYQQNNRWDTSDGDWNYDATTGIVTCTYTLKATDTNGNYYLGYIEVYDEDDIQYRINNLGNSAYTFTLTGATAGGSAAEQTGNYTKVEEITSDSNGKTLVDGNKVTVKFKVATNGELQYARARLEFFDAYEVNYGTGVNTDINYTKEIDATPVAGQAGYYQAEYVLQDTDLYGVYTVEVATNTRYGNDNTDYKTTESDIMFRFDQKATTTLNRLAPATNLNWTADGYARFTLPENHQGTMSVRLHREDQGTNNWSTGWSTSGMSKDDVEYYRDTGDDILRCMGNPESGKYYFTVTIHGDGINYFDSVTAKSDLFTYTVPNKKLGMVSSIRWDKENKEVLITAPAQETNDYWAEGQWYFGETADDTPQSCGWTSGGWRDEDNGVFHIGVPDMMLQEYGSGTYYMKARLESSNVLAYNHGDWGELSDGFYIGADEADNSTIDKLEDVETENKTANEIREQVQKIDTKDLKVAMLSDEDAAEKIHELEIQANAETQVVSTNDSPVNAANVSAVGAGLNNLTGTPKLVIDKAKQDDVMPAQYDNTVAVRFSMELQNVENPDNLKVPVLIDIPIPDNINHAYLVILHYHLTTNQPERITPYVYQAGNKWYAQFVLTRFSDFIMTEDLEAKKNASKTPTELIKEFVTRCYRIILSREPEQEGLDYWTQKLASGEMTAAEIINSFVYSNEFQSKHLSYEDSVEVLYTVMLDRASDAGGKAYWVSVLQAGNPFGAIINGFCNSDEFTGICAGYGIKPGSVDTNGQAQAPAPAPAADMNKIRAFVTRNYRVILGREPDADGLNYWAQRLASGEATAAEIINGFVESIEFRGKNLSYGDQVEVLYQVMLDRGSDADGKAYWMSMLNGGNPLAAVINGFCNSIEFKGICTEYGITPGSVAVGELKPPKAVPVVDMDKLRAYVTRCYRIILGREPDQEGLNYWTGKMATGELQAAAIIDEFVNSIEFMDKQLSDREAVEVLYQAMLGRGSDEAGMGYWLEKLNAGEPFAVIINGFCNSVEFKGICAEALPPDLWQWPLSELMPNRKNRKFLKPRQQNPNRKLNPLPRTSVRNRQGPS